MTYWPNSSRLWQTPRANTVRHSLLATKANNDDYYNYYFYNGWRTTRDDHKSQQLYERRKLILHNTRFWNILLFPAINHHRVRLLYIRTNKDVTLQRLSPLRTHKGVTSQRSSLVWLNKAVTLQKSSHVRANKAVTSQRSSCTNKQSCDITEIVSCTNELESFAASLNRLPPSIGHTGEPWRNGRLASTICRCISFIWMRPFYTRQLVATMWKTRQALLLQYIRIHTWKILSIIHYDKLEEYYCISIIFENNVYL